MKNEEVEAAAVPPSTFILHPCPNPVVIELKKPGLPARAAFDENLTHYQERIDTSPQPSPRSKRRGRCCSGSKRCWNVE